MHPDGIKFTIIADDVDDVRLPPPHNAGAPWHALRPKQQPTRAVRQEWNEDGTHAAATAAAVQSAAAQGLPLPMAAGRTVSVRSPPQPRQLRTPPPCFEFMAHDAHDVG